MIQRKSHHSPKSPERQKDAEATETPKIDLANRMALSIPEMAEVLNIAAPVAYEISSQEDFPAFYIGHHKLVSK